MTAPPLGSVIRYAYLWADESAAGREDAGKDRPALVLALAIHQDNGETEVLVLAVTHSPPRASNDAVDFPADEKRKLGLDQPPSWIVNTEANAFTWPGPDIRPIPSHAPGRFTYGCISNALLGRVARSYLANRQRGQAKPVQRTK